MHDLTNVYIGAKYTYNELLVLDEVPFKLKTLISRFILREVDGNTKIEDHIFYLKETDMSYQIYKEMKARFRLNVWKDESDGVKTPGYKSSTYRIAEILGNEELMRKKDITIVEELHITKLGLMGVAMQGIKEENKGKLQNISYGFQYPVLFFEILNVLVF